MSLQTFVTITHPDQATGRELISTVRRHAQKHVRYKQRTASVRPAKITRCRCVYDVANQQSSHQPVHELNHTRPICPRCRGIRAPVVTQGTSDHSPRELLASNRNDPFMSYPIVVQRRATRAVIDHCEHPLSPPVKLVADEQMWKYLLLPNFLSILSLQRIPWWSYFFGML